jgi:hypothetical protein
MYHTGLDAEKNGQIHHEDPVPFSEMVNGYEDTYVVDDLIGRRSSG